MDCETETVTFISVVHETEKGILLQFVSGDAWLSKAHITIEDDVVTYPAWVKLDYMPHAPEGEEF